MQPVGHSNDDVFDRHHREIRGSVRSLRNDRRAPDRSVCDTDIWRYRQDLLPHPIQQRWGDAQPDGLINEDAEYATEYGESFPRPLRLDIYASDIDTTKDASIDSRKKEAVHKERIADWEIYDVAESEANRFIVRIIADVWISPLS